MYSELLNLEWTLLTKKATTFYCLLTIYLKGYSPYHKKCEMEEVERPLKSTKVITVQQIAIIV